MNLPLVIVEWADAWVKEDPITLQDAKNPSIHSPTVVRTIGWVLVDDDVGISLANEYYDDTYRGRTFIPRAMILKVTPFALKAPKKKGQSPSKQNSVPSPNTNDLHDP